MKEETLYYININKESFSEECYCPTSGVGRIPLKDDKDIPDDFIQMAKEIDGDDYEGRYFCIDIIKKGGLFLNYIALDEFVEFGSIDGNYEEALCHYKKYASEISLKETFSE